MIKSMTGFASLTRDDESATIAVTVRSVNHKFLDLQLRVPPVLGPIEGHLRALVQKRVGGDASRWPSACSSAGRRRWTSS
jgi:uncharacterized protein YicC (UPF0701 family)